MSILIFSGLAIQPSFLPYYALSVHKLRNSTWTAHQVLRHRMDTRGGDHWSFVRWDDLQELEINVILIVLQWFKIDKITFTIYPRVPLLVFVSVILWCVKFHTSSLIHLVLFLCSPPSLVSTPSPAPPSVTKHSHLKQSLWRGRGSSSHTAQGQRPPNHSYLKQPVWRERGSSSHTVYGQRQEAARTQWEGRWLPRSLQLCVD